MHQEFFNMLHKDHVEVDGILSKIEMLTGSSRQTYLNVLKQEIVPHMRGEEKAFYPALLENSESKSDAQEGIKEHQEAESTLTRLMGMSATGSDEWMSIFNELKEQIQHHVQDEESKIFDHARTVLSEERMKAIMAEFQSEKERVKKSVSVR
jgi:hemerythrin-like domain-containing protein